MDIVTANYNTNNVGVLLEQKDGTFANVTTYSAGSRSSPLWVVLGDMNNDNRLDIISANKGSGTIGVLLGNGDGTFATVVTYSTDGYSPYSVAIGDVNNDKRLDVVTYSSNSDSVSILLGDGNGTFVLMTTNSTSTSSQPFSIALADFNSDNHLDIVVANTYTNNIGVFLGYGNGRFELQTTYSTGNGSKPYIVIVVDYNHDNRYDLAVTNTATNEVVILFGYGNGSFYLARTYPTGSSSFPYGIAVTDFNNDEQLEIAVALFGTRNVAILTEYYAAEFALQTTYLTGSAPQPYSVATGDFNNKHHH